MREDTDWYAFYQVLGVGSDSDWKTVQRAYRRLAQSSHPDRFKSGTVEHKNAELEIVKINRAYRALSEFYRKNKRLPGQRPRKFTPATSAGESVTNTTGYTSTSEKPSYARRTYRKRGWSKRFTRPLLKTALLFGICLAIYQYYLLPDDYPTEFSVSRPASSAETQSIEDNSADSPSSIKDSRYFTPGSTMGEVHAIQGNPSFTEGSTWYYGKSYVTFVDGILKNWKNDPDNPLKIKPVDPDSPTRTAHSRLTSRFTIGSTKADVLAVQGQPTSKSETRWDYGLSKVYFNEDNRVVKWFESPLQPLKVDQNSR